MPPLPLVALLALYWSTQVCMRALPAVSLAYFASTAFGNTALPVGIGAGAAAGVAASFFAAAAAGAGAGAAAAGAAAGVASAAHWALRKSFHFMLPSVPSFLAAWYFALHSCVVSAFAGAVAANAAKPDSATAHNKLDLKLIPDL